MLHPQPRVVVCPHVTPLGLPLSLPWAPQVLVEEAVRGEFPDFESCEGRLREASDKEHSPRRLAQRFAGVMGGGSQSPRTGSGDSEMTADSTALVSPGGPVCDIGG